MRTEYYESIKLTGRPADLDAGRHDGSGTIEVSAVDFHRKHATGVEVIVTGEYALWSRSELAREAAALLANVE